MIGNIDLTYLGFIQSVKESALTSAASEVFFRPEQKFSVISIGSDLAIEVFNEETKTLDITFKGSNDIEDWISNFKYLKTLSREEFTPIANQFSNLVRWKDAKAINIYGYSRGGMIAQELALILNSYSTRLRTYGSPDILGKTNYPVKFEWDAYINGRDIVPRFSKHPTYPNASSLNFLKEPNIHIPLSLSIVRAIYTKGNCPEIKDHAVVSYISSILKWRKNE